MAIKIDAYSACINKYGEEFGGDQTKIIRNEYGVTAILVDGKGSGAKISLLTSFAVKIVSTMIDSGVSIDQATDMIVESQSSDRTENIAFTLILARFDGNIYIEQFETPDVLLLRHGKPIKISMNQRALQDKTIRSAVISAKQADTILSVNSGMLNAGVERSLKNGWNLETISAYMVNAYRPKASAEDLVRLLLAAGDSLSFEKPKSNLSVLAFRVKE